MKGFGRLLGIVCLLVPFSLSAQTLTMKNGWTATVTAQGQNYTTNSVLVSQSLAVNASWDSKLTANPDTLLKIWFLQGSTNLANTPLLLTNVKLATLAETQGYLYIQLTPAVISSQPAVDEANKFLASKTPTGEFCLNVKSVLVKSKRAVILSNGMIAVATGKIDLLPPNGKSGCVCGRGLAPANGSEIEIFEVQSRCVTAKKK
jgi:hypothetical protein